MKYDIYFEIYGKKLKTTIEAINVYEAKKQIRDKIIFHKIEEIEEIKPLTDEEPQFNLDDLKDLLGIK